MNVDKPDIQTEILDVDYKLQHQLESVINFGFGAEQKISELVSLYGSFITNYSGVNPNSDTDLSLGRYNIYHLTVGSTFTLFNLKLTAGLGFGFGTERLENYIDFSSANPETDLVGEPGTQDIRYRSLKLVFGLSTGL